MFRFVLAAVMAVFLCLPTAACDQFDHVVGLFRNAQADVEIFAPEDLPAVVETMSTLTDVDIGEATRAFIVVLSTKAIVGIEVDGCLLAPITIAERTPAQLSGQSPDGRIGS